MNKRLAAAMGAYAVLIAIGVYLLHGKTLYVNIGGYPLRVNFLWVVVLIFGALIAKTLIAARAGWTYHSETERPESDSIVNQTDSTFTS
jgi:hypothetical protein